MERIILICYALLSIANAQEWMLEDEYYDVTNNPLAYEEIILQLEQNPLDVNGDLSALIELSLISRPIADSILTYRLMYGDLVSRAEFRLIGKGVARALNRIGHLIYVGSNEPKQKSILKVRMRYQWSRLNNDLRENGRTALRFATGKWSGGLTYDMPEDQNPNGALAGGFNYQSKMVAVVIGNFRPDWGRGLLFTNRFGQTTYNVYNQLYFDRPTKVYPGMLTSRLRGISIRMGSRDRGLEVFASQNSFFESNGARGVDLQTPVGLSISEGILQSRIIGARYTSQSHRSDYFIGSAMESLLDTNAWMNTGYAFVGARMSASMDMVLGLEGWAMTGTGVIKVSEASRLSVRQWFTEGSFGSIYGSFGASNEERRLGSHVLFESTFRRIEFGTSLLVENRGSGLFQQSKRERYDLWFSSELGELSIIARFRRSLLTGGMEAEGGSEVSLIRLRMIQSSDQNRFSISVDLVPTQNFGWVLYQDVKLNKGRIDLFIRSYFIAIDAWQERVYVYENDMLYAHAMEVFSRPGWRVCGLARLKLNRKVTMEIKTALSSELDQRRTDVSAQLRWRF